MYIHYTAYIWVAISRHRYDLGRGIGIRPPRSPEPTASGASKWAGVDDGRLPSLSQMQMFMAATILEGGCREASGRIHMNSAGGHENSATGYVVAEGPLFELSAVGTCTVVPGGAKFCNIK